MSKPHAAAVRAFNNTIYATDAPMNFTREYEPLVKAAWRAVADILSGQVHATPRETAETLREALRGVVGEEER